MTTVPAARAAAGNVETAVRARRSTIRLTAPAPGPDELLDLLPAAATAPDHGQLRPWRVIAICGTARARLGEAAAEAAPAADLAERIVAKHLRAPLMLALVFQPRDHPTIPRWEQLAATAAMATTLLLLDARGWGGVWFGGPCPNAPQVRKHLGVGDGEQLLGYLYIGTPVPGEESRPRAPADVRSKFSWLGDTAL
ncbi:nitroreductase family protein [Streptomyces sp. NBC_00825]|uniref:nitroreductase family protein n=1 Tax=unclassified Streptomyces TaxID=2593676 RepID=UPI002ED09822|nr:nitroreductase family protein [Streptomyces sp. NBC_00826]WTH89046.1 nitroreductase family protein [Streptomyces sp. NBC_00825]WTH97776.1 nitroreductase family protein [Streptomyces sp. NBC_00822]